MVRKVGDIPDYSVVWAVTLSHSIPHSSVVWTNLNIHQYLHWHQTTRVRNRINITFWDERGGKELEARSLSWLRMSLSDFWAGGELPFDKWSQIWSWLHTPDREKVQNKVYSHKYGMMSIINIYDQFDHPYHTHWLTGGHRTSVVTSHTSSGREGEWGNQRYLYRISELFQQELNES